MFYREYPMAGGGLMKFNGMKPFLCLWSCYKSYKKATSAVPCLIPAPKSLHGCAGKRSKLKIDCTARRGATTLALPLPSSAIIRARPRFKVHLGWMRLRGERARMREDRAARRWSNRCSNTAGLRPTRPDIWDGSKPTISASKILVTEIPMLPF